MAAFDFKNYTAKQYFLFAYALTFLILTIIALVALFKQEANIKLARRTLNGLLALSMFGIGYIAGTHADSMTAKGSWNARDMTLSALGIVFIILAINTIAKVDKGQPKDIESAKTSMKGIGFIAAAMFVSVAMQHGDKVKLFSSV